MRSLCRLALLALLLILTGCAGKKHLSRQAGGFETVPAVTSFRAPIKAVASDVFSGHFEMIYEKKIPGSVDNVMITGNRYVAFMTTRRRFLVVDQSTGKRLCRIQRRKGLMFDPAVDDSLLALVDRTPWGRIEVVNIFSGKTISRKVEGDIKTGPIEVQGKLVFGTAHGLRSLTFPGLKLVWEDTSDVATMIPPVSDQAVIYSVSGTRQVKAVAADRGTTIWSVDLNGDVASEISLGRFIYLGLADGRFIALDRTDGSPVWESIIGYPVRGGAAEEGESIFFGCTDGKIYALDASNGALRWSYQTDGVVTATPLVFGTAVIVGSLDRYLYSINGASGQLIERVQLNGPITAQVTTVGARIFAATRNNRIYCFEGR
ncbi:MAG: PQQ-binding-like beta-propeller repeat protein [candidate division Zixibacteria bacterium]|nr:PQQ-binding-like beta-propeller repeat protein [candidate division Zixibacteria bacterium]